VDVGGKVPEGMGVEGDEGVALVVGGDVKSVVT